MARLMLLRHAKSDWSDPAWADIERPLNPRGKKAAPVMGNYLVQNRFFPDLILCSTAQRTRETLAGILPFLPHETEIRLLQALYDASEDTYLPLIRQHGGTAQNLMLIGHNPATEDTALSLFASGDPALHEDMQLKYPSGALCVYDIELESWNTLTSNSGHLSHFAKPRDLSPAE